MSQKCVIMSTGVHGSAMKKKDIVDLVRYYVDGNDSGFRELAYDIAIEFNQKGDTQLGNYIFTLLSSRASSFVPQAVGFSSDFFRKIEPSSDSLIIPDAIMDDINGIINAVGHKAGIDKFLFSGPPGTGKTEMARHLARILDRHLYSVSFENVIDSHLGQSSKNILQLFDEINRQSFPESLIILFDEIDALAMDRINSHDLREMGRATSALMKGLDELNPDVILLATTNMVDYFDKALLRRFDKVVDFSRYTKKDLADIGSSLLSNELKKFRVPLKNSKLCGHIFRIAKNLPYPGELKNLIRTSIAFSDPAAPEAYVRNLFIALFPDCKLDSHSLQELGFSLREMEVILGVPRSTLSRQLTREGCK